MKRSPFSARGGFTLLEIMLVVAIIILLLGAAVFKMKPALGQAKMARAQADIQSLQIPLTSYEALGGNLPTTSQGLKAIVEKPTSEPRPRMWSPGMESLPKDPWNHDYFYEQPGKHNPKGYDLYSAGPDGVPNTDDDLGNWEAK